MPTETETQELVNKILETMRPEALAVEMDKSLATIYLWKAGKRNADRGDFLLLQTIEKRL